MVMTEQDARIRAIPLSSLPVTSRELLSNLLNGTKVIPTQDRDKLFRDWRGLCVLANIPLEIQTIIGKSPDQVAAILKQWCSRDHNIVVGDLLDNLERLDRFDAYDDIYEDLVKNYQYDGRIVNHQNATNPPDIIVSDEDDIITYDDRPGYKHQYDAFVLYADEDKPFVDDISLFLTNEGFQICTKEKVLPGHATLFAPVAKLISERCQRIILIYSPDFLSSPANTFFRDYAQAISIESRTNKTIPIMYRSCYLPPHLAVYHMLHYHTEMYDFWAKLGQTVNIGRMLRLLPAREVRQQRQIQPIGIQSSHSVVNIMEMSNTAPCLVSHANTLSTQLEDHMTPQRSVSVEIIRDIGRNSSPEGSIISGHSEILKKKSSKSNPFKKIYRIVKGKKVKEPVPC